MKNKKIIILASSILMATPFLSGCAAKIFEKDINVVFMNEGEVVDTGTVNQFVNIKSPTIDSAYIPTDYKFVGWSVYTEATIDKSSAAAFKSQYIGGGRMVHYMDVEKYADNSTVILNAIIMHKDDIPKEYHYAVVAWYDKAATSGITEGEINTCEENLKVYLSSQGVSDDDLASILFRAYSGNVGPSTGQIVYDDDVDIMLGWGSVSNITTTGQIPESIIEESVEFPVTYQGAAKTRYLHRISKNAGGIEVMNWLKTDEAKAIFVS